MVRTMNCPYCGKPVKVSSHWPTAICPSCHGNFDVGVEIFELTPEEQAKENEAALKKIKAEEDERDARVKKTRTRMRAMLHLPAEDPHAGVNFEDDEHPQGNDDAPDKKNTDDRKKKVIIAAAAGVIALFLLIVILFFATVIRRMGGGSSGQQPSQQAQAVSSDSSGQQAAEASSEANDGEWSDGYSIDSNTKDAEHKIDLQSSDGQKDYPSVSENEPAPSGSSFANTADVNTVSESSVPVSSSPLLSSGSGSEDKAKASANSASEEASSTQEQDTDAAAALVNGSD